MKNISILSIKKNSFIGKEAKILSFCRVYDSSIGDYTYVGRFSNIISTNIGKYCSIAPGSKIGVSNHPINMVSTSPMFYSEDSVFKKSYCKVNFIDVNNTRIGNDVWIGMNCVIKSGVNIGDGAIIGAGSIVTKDVAAYTIVGGVPAKEIRKRFSDDKIKMLLKIKWWNWKEEDIKKYSYKFKDIDEFLLNFMEKKNEICAR